MYNTLLFLSRNTFFYKLIKLQDSFEIRLYLMFFHCALMMIIFKKKGKIFDQKSYDSLFHSIENDLRELGFGDVSVNKKMKEFNKVLYDIVLKIEDQGHKEFKLNRSLILSYFKDLDASDNEKYGKFENYFINFYNFCFELPINHVIKDSIKFSN